MPNLPTPNSSPGNRSLNSFWSESIISPKLLVIKKMTLFKLFSHISLKAFLAIIVYQACNQGERQLCVGDNHYRAMPSQLLADGSMYDTARGSHGHGHAPAPPS